MSGPVGQRLGGQRGQGHFAREPSKGPPRRGFSLVFPSSPHTLKATATFGSWHHPSGQQDAAAAGRNRRVRTHARTHAAAWRHRSGGSRTTSVLCSEEVSCAPLFARWPQFAVSGSGYLLVHGWTNWQETRAKGERCAGRHCATSSVFFERRRTDSRGLFN